MTANERNILLTLEEKYKVVIWRRLYAANADGEIETGMSFSVDGMTIMEVWRK